MIIVNKKNKYTKGFTLLELVLYMAILSILLTAVVSLQISLANTSMKAALFEDAARNRRAALSSLEYMIKNSDGLLRDVFGSCSDMSSTTPLLALYFDDDTYLPGTCVNTGGGVKITVDNDSHRLKLTCYPDITNNGQYQACSATAGNTYYLTDPNVSVYKETWKVSTSTVTSTKDGFPVVTATLGVGSVNNNQRSLAATSTATSTAVMLNDHPEGLVAWWRFDANSLPSTYDSITGNKMTCYSPDYVDGLISGSTGAFDFIRANSDYCYYSGSGSSSAWADIYNLDGAFTLSGWVKMHYNYAGYNEYNFISKSNTGSRLGYHVTILSNSGSNGRVWARIFDSESSYQNSADTSSNKIADGNVYNITYRYNPPQNKAELFIYQKGVGGISTTTTNNILTIVHDTTAGGFRIGNAVDGIMDEFRIYNRAISNSELWAIQSQGAN